MYFVNYQPGDLETSAQNDRDHLSLHEATFMVALSKYLIQQGYDQSQVIIVATNDAQVTKIKEHLHGEPLLKGVNATTADCFQDDNDIVLISFAGSFDKKIVQLLESSNGVNVALSRAREGLYCIGDFRKIVQGPHFPWNKLFSKLQTKQAIGDALGVRCQNHGTKKTMKTEGDFLKYAPEGGCSKYCRKKFRCGHICSRVCHIMNKDLEHARMQENCNEKCNGRCIRGHPCPDKCHYPRKCTTLHQIGILQMACRHNVLLTCSDDPASIRCVKPCERNRSCGHKCTRTCGEICDEIICMEIVEVKLPCNHTVTTNCSDATIDLGTRVCFVETYKIRDSCQHYVRVPCWKDAKDISCLEPCTKYRNCGHKCKERCNDICDDINCTENVEVKAPCGHPVIIYCSDAESDSILWNACNVPCNVKLKCTHRCRGTCGQCRGGRLHKR